MPEDIRWTQRFQNFNKAFLKFESAILVLEKTGLSELEREGLIQRFKYTHELAWNVVKDFFESEGNKAVMGSRSATWKAFKKGLIVDGENWMDMIYSRNLTMHTYNEEVVDEITNKIITSYYPAFKNLTLFILGKVDEQLDDLLLPYTFDLSIYHQIKSPELLDHMNRVGKLFFYKKPEN